jgi:hypothetical protein
MTRFCTHKIKRGEYKQEFKPTGNHQPTVPKVPV